MSGADREGVPGGALFGLCVAPPATAQDRADLARQLANSIASLISVPFQFNIDTGYGPVFLLPTATGDAPGGDKWGAGPTGVALVQSGPWTFGALANHLRSFAGDEGRHTVNATFLQPFLNYTTQGAVTYFLNAEATYDWSGDDIAIPINLGVNKLLSVGDQKVQLGSGVRYWEAEAENGHEGFGARINVVFLFPN